MHEPRGRRCPAHKATHSALKREDKHARDFARERAATRAFRARASPESARPCATLYRDGSAAFPGEPAHFEEVTEVVRFWAVLMPVIVMAACVDGGPVLGITNGRRRFPLRTGCKFVDGTLVPQTLPRTDRLTMIGLRQLINSVVQRLREQEANETQPVAQDLATPRQGLPRLLSEEDERASHRQTESALLKP